MVGGIILILLGGLLVASNVGLVPYGLKKIIVSWQMLLIVIGIISVFKRRALFFKGFSMLCLGIFFIIPKLATVFPSVFGGIDADNFVSVYWPLLLIAGGIILILHVPVSHNHEWRSHSSFHHCGRQFVNKRGYLWKNETSQDKENCRQDENFLKTCVFGNGRYVIDTEFKGGTLHAVFGGIELDLRKSYLPEGETSMNIEAIFGGVSLFVPDDWLLEVQIESVLGGIDDARRIVAVDTSRRLIIKGSVVFGGVEIKN
jgi:predicted membrane protein